MIDHEVINAIGRALQSIMPFEAREMLFFGKIYPSHSGRKLVWRRHDGSEGWFRFGMEPSQQLDLVSELAEKFRLSPSFSKERWSHFRVVLTDRGALNFDFSYIPEDDDWVGVFMRRVSDLTAEEAAAACIPEKDWLQRVRRRAEQEGITTS